MRILFLGNNTLAVEVLRWLRQEGDAVVGLVLHPAKEASCRSELTAAAGTGIPVFDASTLDRAETREAIRAVAPDIGVSVMFGYILRPAFLALFPRGVVNLHPSFLPHNRGAYPNVWSIVDRTPAGATMHYIDRGIDTGDIVEQTTVEVDATDTGGSLYGKLEQASLDLFQRTWPLLRDGSAQRVPQAGNGTSHRTGDVVQIDEIDLDRLYRAGDLIDIIRARTFPPYEGAFFRVGGEKIYLRLQLLTEQELKGASHV